MNLMISGGRASSLLKVLKMAASTNIAGVHRLLVEALGDAKAIAQLDPDGYISPEIWRAAVERVRLAQFAHLPAWEGAVAVGAFIATRFLDSEPGRLTHESLRMMTLDRAMIAVVMPMSERMRRAAEFDFRPSPSGGGFIDIRGTLEVSAAMVLGLYRELINRVPGRHEVKLVTQRQDFISLEVTVSV